MFKEKNCLDFVLSFIGEEEINNLIIYFVYVKVGIVFGSLVSWGVRYCYSGFQRFRVEMCSI